MYKWKNLPKKCEPKMINGCVVRWRQIYSNKIREYGDSGIEGALVGFWSIAKNGKLLDTALTLPRAKERAMRHAQD